MQLGGVYLAKIILSACACRGRVIAKWKHYNVISANYFSTWNCLTDQLTTITKEVINKIDDDQKKHRKKD